MGNNNIKIMEKRLQKLEECNEQIRTTLIQLTAEIKENTKKTNEVHRAVLGNGDPRKGLADRVSRTEVELKVIMWVVGITISGLAGYIFKILLG